MKKLSKSVLVIAFLLTTLSPFVACGADELRPGRLPSEVRAALLPGLQMTITDVTGKADTTSLRMLALRVGEGQTSTPFVSAGPFRAKIVGYAKTRLRSEYKLWAAGTGRVRILVNNELIGEFDLSMGELSQSPEISFAKGYNKLDVEYQSPQSGDSVLRVHWSCSDFPREPIAPSVLFYDGRNEDYLKGKLLRDGRFLLAQHNCLKCHEKPVALANWDGKGMPELDRDAPLLANLSDRVTPKWLVNWLLHPQAMRTHTTMPRLLHGETAQTDATNIAAYLLADEPNSQDSDAQTDLSAAAKKGMVVYEDRGCIACHRFSAPETEDEFDRLSFHFIAEKYRPGALANFLADPRKHYQWSRMPVVPLSPEEAQQLEAYIRKNVKGEIAEVSLAAADAAAGKTSFTRLGCVQCHKTASENPSVAPTAKPWLELSKGCLSDGEIRNSPDFKFTDDQRTAIGTLLQTDGNSLKQSVSTEFTQRQVANLSCIACHQRDNDDADYPYVLLEFGERGLAPDAVPSLTWVGEKLQPQWVEQLILGKLAYRPRPHFRTRMPAFPARGKQLTVGLTHQHGFGFEEDPRPQHDEKLAAIGKQVAAMQTGLACHRCHAIGDKQAVAPMEARSTNLTYATNRLRHEFYLRWMTDPLRIDPATKMIKFAQDGKKTGLESHYDGDAEKQFKAVWHYLESLRKEKAK